MSDRFSIKAFFQSEDEPNFFYFDKQNILKIPSLNVSLAPGNSIALLGTRGTDVVDIYKEFISLNPLKYNRRNHLPVIRCVNRNVDLSLRYSAYENFCMSESSFIPYSKKKLMTICQSLCERFRIDFSLTIPLSQLTESERVIVAVLHAYLSGADIFVCGNLLSTLTLKDRSTLLSFFSYLKAEEHKRILYLTSKWEFAVMISDYIIVFGDRIILGEASANDVIKNPQKLIYLISGKTLINQKSETKKPADILEMLYNGASYYSDNFKLSESFSFVLNGVVKTLYASSCTLVILDNDTNNYHFYSNDDSVSPSLSSEFLKTFYANPKDVFYSTSEDVSFPSIFQKAENVKTIIAVPVYNHNIITGILAVFFSSSIIYDDEQLMYLKSFSKEIAIIIETSKLMGSSVLLRESNHRIKNNLQIIVSLITLQQSYLNSNPDADINDSLDSLTNRIQNIAMIHEKLTKADSYQSGMLLKSLLLSVIKPYSDTDINFIVESDDISVPYKKATSIAMIINELVVNSIKYAFINHKNSANYISISCKIENKDLVIVIEDNGCGLPDDISIDSSSSIGFSIIKMLSNSDLNGEIKICNTGQGTKANLCVPFFT